LPNDIVELYKVLDDNKVRTGEIKFVHGHYHDLIYGNNLHSSSVDNGSLVAGWAGSMALYELAVFDPFGSSTKPYVETRYVCNAFHGTFRRN
jgi:hypothetical protein